MHMLHAWRWSTLLSYNSAVKRFILFAKKNNRWRGLPVSGDVITEFCLEIGRSFADPSRDGVSSKTLTKYLFGIQAWHIFHGATYPTGVKPRINLILRACDRVVCIFPKNKLKKSIHIKHLIFIYKSLHNGEEEQKAILDLILVAFWGMARLKELTYDNNEGPVSRWNSILTTDVDIRKLDGKKVTLRLREAKTASAGETQLIKLRGQPNILCPVEAVSRRLANARGAETSLFGYYSGKKRVHLLRERVIHVIQLLLNNGGYTGFSGHSFRIGGASLRNALGIPVEEICSLGRWKSDCYKLYIRKYERCELVETKQLLHNINKAN
ncbi:hypothetical protein PSHT_04656 [Puccinia striiformis]|uniref:Tyr recombinase domain-containing protein n=1 Tax=Puccinia striiformis TaxID=27350 RepID=A0A2S4WCI6_9BASI|nr:hypothetical protein PSHT_04656 [Puccinia striiformis]